MGRCSTSASTQNNAALRAHATNTHACARIDNARTHAHVSPCPPTINKVPPLSRLLIILTPHSSPYSIPSRSLSPLRPSPLSCITFESRISITLSSLVLTQLLIVFSLHILRILDYIPCCSAGILSSPLLTSSSHLLLSPLSPSFLSPPPLSPLF